MATEESSKISHPGTGWHMLWPTGGITNIQLDVVGFLAILGEDAVKKTSRLASLSSLFLLPRLIPAPHSLLYSERPEELDVLRAKVVGVHSGNLKDHLSHVGSAVFARMPPFTVRCCVIRAKDTSVRPKKWFGGTKSGHHGSDTKESILRARLSGPVVLANVFGCALSIVLLVLSVVFGDGMSLLATLLLSLTSVLVGITNHWQLKVPTRRLLRNLPPGDTVIWYPNGSFLVVRCDEELARQLFFSPETIDYTLSQPNGFILLSLLGTLFLMISVVALANAKTQLQISWAISYVILNIAHWLAAALPRRLNWDFSILEMAEQGLEDGPESSSFTEALWKAILLTEDTRWVRRSGAAPETPAWEEWLTQAGKAAKPGRSYIGHLTNPIWRGEYGLEALVWANPTDWSPKAALDQAVVVQSRALADADAV